MKFQRVFCHFAELQPAFCRDSSWHFCESLDSLFWRQVALDSLDCAAGPAECRMHTACISGISCTKLVTNITPSQQVSTIRIPTWSADDQNDDQDVSVGNVAVLATILGPPALPQGATNAAAMMCQCFRDEFLCSVSCWCLKPKACEFPNFPALSSDLTATNCWPTKWWRLLSQGSHETFLATASVHLLMLLSQNSDHTSPNYYWENPL